MIRVSTGFKYQLLGGTAFQNMFHNSVILLYTGAMPDSADLAVADTPAATITKNGETFIVGSPNGGLNWTLNTGGVIVPSTQDWFMHADLAGTLVWGRLCQNNDTQENSFSQARIDFEVNSLDGYGLSMSNATVGAGDVRSVDFAMYAIPPL